jgi:tetratricopeptide (TPR) repeat protein
MESYRLKSKVSANDKEFLVQTVNDASQKSVVSSLFVDGKILEISRYPHDEKITDQEILKIVQSTHDVKKSELEQLLSMRQKVTGSGDADLMLNLGITFYCKRIYDEARELFATILELKPDHHQAANYLGLACLEQSDFKEAVKSLALAVELRPAYADYHNNYGEALLEAEFCQRAVEELETALKLNTYYADAYFNLGIAYIFNAIKREDFEMYSNMREKTTDLFDRAALISPEFKTVQYDEAREVFRLNDLPRALNLFKAVRSYKKELSRQRFSGFYLRFLLYSDWADEKTVVDRIRFLKEKIAINRNYVDLRQELAYCHLQQARLNWKKAIDQFREAYEMNPRLSKAEKGLERAEEFAETMKEVVAEIVKTGQSE